MRITADTNVLVRASVGDNAEQTAAARQLLRQAVEVCVPVTVFCEFAWVLSSIYRYSRPQIGAAIEQYLAADTISTDRDAVRAGLAVLAQGGDFSDGAVAFQGRAVGGATFASFDREARHLLDALGYSTLGP